MKTDKIDYFAHDTFSREDEKLQNVIMEWGYEGIGIYWCLIELLYENGGVLQKQYERIAFALRTDKDKIKRIIEDYGLFDFDKNVSSKSVNQRIKRILNKSEKARKSVMQRWHKIHKQQPNNDNTNVLPTYSKRNTIKLNKSKLNKSKESIKENKKPLEEDFEKIGEQFNASVDWVKKEYAEMKDWLLTHNRHFANEIAGLRNWIRSDIDKYNKTPPPYTPKEQRISVINMLKEGGYNE